MIQMKRDNTERNCKQDEEKYYLYNVEKTLELYT